MRLRFALLALALVVLSAPSIFHPQQASAAKLGVVSDLTWTGSWDDQDRTGAAIAYLRARWVKLTVDWNRLEPSPTSYDRDLLAYYDRAIGVASAAGARVLVLVSRSPRWASGSDNVEAPPLDPRNFARFVGFLAHRWADRVAAWEIWNEPNTARFWPPAPDPTAYVALLKQAFSAIRTADPTARVVFGGLANLSEGARSFLYASYQAGANDYFDVLGWHAYTYCGASPRTIWYSPSGWIRPWSFVGYRTARDDTAQWGDPKPVWLTEFGWSTSSETCTAAWTSGVGEDVQARYLLEAAALMEESPWLRVAFWYALRNNFWDFDADRIEARFGLARSNWSPKPAYEAFRVYAGLSAP